MAPDASGVDPTGMCPPRDGRLLPITMLRMVISYPISKTSFSRFPPYSHLIYCHRSASPIASCIEWNDTEQTGSVPHPESHRVPLPIRLKPTEAVRYRIDPWAVIRWYRANLPAALTLGSHHIPSNSSSRHNMGLLARQTTPSDRPVKFFRRHVQRASEKLSRSIQYMLYYHSKFNYCEAVRQICTVVHRSFRHKT